MKLIINSVSVLLLICLCACSTSTHYTAHHGYHGRHSHSGVSVGVSGHSHGGSGAVLGALIVGGVIGHLLTRPAEDEQQHTQGANAAQPKTKSVKAHADTEETQRFYQRGEDGVCYFMQRQGDEIVIISEVPDYSCP